MVKKQPRFFCTTLGIAALIAGLSTPACGQRGRNDEVAKPAIAPQPDKSLAWARPRSDERLAERREMVRRQIAARGITDRAVLEAMGNVPRHWFVPGQVEHLAYADRPLPIGEGQTISQPYIVALMTETLGLTRDSKVLEVGTGSGYQAAVLAEITPHVFTIEIVQALADRAKADLQRRGYKTISTRAGDGYAGWPKEAPFDAIIVACAPGHLPPKLFEQLKPGGRLCIPVGAQGDLQSLQLVTKDADGGKHVRDLIPVRFVPMTGEADRTAPPDGQ